VKIIDQQILDDLTRRARENPRLRQNYNLHPADASRGHRLFNAVEPDSYIRPHRHLDPEKDETFLIVRGRLGVITFADDGSVLETALLEGGGANLVADLPHGVYHTAVSLAPGTIFFEAKAGPFLPLTEAEKAAWSPVDGAPEAAAYLARLKALFPES
jgi:cupin fold WbuC family metalloprotein